MTVRPSACASRIAEPQRGIRHVVAAHDLGVLRIALPEERHDRDRRRRRRAASPSSEARADGRAKGMARHGDDVEAVEALRAAPARPRRRRSPSASNAAIGAPAHGAPRHARPGMARADYARSICAISVVDRLLDVARAALPSSRALTAASKLARPRGSWRRGRRCRRRRRCCGRCCGCGRARPARSRRRPAPSRCSPAPARCSRARSRKLCATRGDAAGQAADVVAHRGRERHRIERLGDHALGAERDEMLELARLRARRHEHHRDVGGLAGSAADA